MPRLLLPIVALAALVGSACDPSAIETPDGLPHPQTDLESDPVSADDTGWDVCSNVLCGSAHHCEAVDNQAHCVADVPDGDSCSDLDCGSGTECQMVQPECSFGDCRPAPRCVAQACDELPPEDGCDAECSSGYLMQDGESTCGCCSPDDEDVPTLCLSDDGCSGEGVCDLENYCEAPPDCDKEETLCPSVCYGRCVAAAFMGL